MTFLQNDYSSGLLSTCKCVTLDVFDKGHRLFTSVSVTPLDSFQDDLGASPAVFAAIELAVFCRDLGKSPAVFVATKTGILNQNMIYFDL